MSDLAVAANAYAAERPIAISFNWRSLIPLAALGVVLVLHEFLPAAPAYRVKPLPYFSGFLYILLAIFAILAVWSVFSKKRREKLAYKSWLYGASFLLLGGFFLGVWFPTAGLPVRAS